MIRKFIGAIITFAASVSILVFLFVLIVALFNISSPYIDFPLLAIGHTFLVYVGMFAAFFIIFIPALFLMFLGLTIINKKNFFHSAAVFVLIGVWSLSLIVMGVISAKLMPEYRNFVETSPLYRETSMDFPLKDFSGIAAENGNRVTITQGNTFSVTARGRSQSIENLSFNIEDNVLTINNKRDFKICVFCLGGSPDIDIVMPKLTNISASNGSKITTANTINADDLSVKLANGSNTTLLIQAKNLHIEGSNASGASISGKATTATFDLSNASHARAANLILENAIVKAENGSVADLHVEKTLNADLQNGSIVTYEGNPTIEKSTSNGSRVEKRD